ncbi:cytidine deaminase [Dermacoccus nishinomiyaensis]|uniref:cytidine deaminase n=1 Tax=Dermacoccus nishinomiyaensis TaxID=1274 RepID=UPI0009F87838
MSEHSRVTASAAQTPDWAHLRSEAIAASRRAYVPYSRFPVGVAALTTSGRVLTGCNVENAAYGVALCAECGLVSSLLNTSDRDGLGGGVNAGVADNAMAGADCSDAGLSDGGAGPVVDATAARERLVALSCVDGNGTPITPCGRCRQLLAEHAVAPSVDSPGLLIDMDGRDPLPFVELLPHAFGVTNLDAVATSVAQLKGES